MNKTYFKPPLCDSICFAFSEPGDSHLAILQELNSNGLPDDIGPDVTRVAVVCNFFDQSVDDREAIRFRHDGHRPVVGFLRGTHKPPHCRMITELIRSDKNTFSVNPTYCSIQLTQYCRSNNMRIMIHDSREDLRRWCDADDGPVLPPQSTNKILMIAPTAFAMNTEAALDNHFMQQPKGVNVSNLALKEYSEWFCALQTAGIDVKLFSHAKDTPDAVFPNNWFSTHRYANDSPTLVLYPMKVSNRRLERKNNLIDFIKSSGGYDNIVDITDSEESSPPSFLEGTGSLILDHINKVAYLAASERSNVELAQSWSSRMGFDLVAFNSFDASGQVVYHTNVVMCVGTTFAVLCAEGITDELERSRVLESLESTGHQVLEITHSQVDQFCGNVLELESGCGERILAMSTKAWEAFGENGREFLLRHVEQIVHAPIDTIETCGGGGARCSIAELF